MSQYVQLLGSDTPNGYGGCCFYAPLDHPALHEAITAVGIPSTTAEDADANSSCTGSSARTLHAVVPVASSAPRGTAQVLAEATASSARAPSTSAREGAVHGANSNANGAARTGEERATPWEWSSYLNAPRPTWPRVGPLHADSILHPSAPRTDGATASGAGAAPRVTADTGSSGSEGYVFFNCPEGTQRFSSEANIKLKKVRGFFFTRWSAVPHGRPDPAGVAEGVGAASAVMGLPGMLFTINDAGARHATFFGPSAVLDHDSEPHCGGDPLAGATHAGSPALPGTPSRPPAPPPSSSSSKSCTSAGLRGFLTALRFHYFQYRPMVFRQLHGVVPCRPYGGGGDGGGMPFTCGASATAAAACAALGGNQLHFVETASACDGHPSAPDSHDEAATSATSAEPFVHLVLPLSSQSLLIAFCVSGGRSDGRASASPAADDGRFVAHDAAARHATAHGAETVTPTPTPHTFRAPSSTNAVFGYAVVVAPGASFDAARARALGIKPGPKYGQLKQGVAVEVDAEDGAGWRGGKPDALSTEGASEKTHDQQPPQRARRLVHPFNVMRPTPATRNAYVSLVLDGDDAADVQAALTRLLGRCSAAAPASAAAAPATAEEGGVLVRLLRGRFPHLAYFYDDEVEEDEQTERGATGAVPSPTRGLRRRPRQLCVRHVVHVQPSSYFEHFAQRHGGGMAPSSKVYAAYNAFVFAHVARGACPAASAPSSSSTAVEVSVAPSLSFTLADLADVDGASAAAMPSACVPGTPRGATWHLFTSFVQRHFTAFPTALVHRYHLHHLAPSLFPLQLPSDGRSAPHTDSAPVEYWPYSLKLRCVPEAALQLTRRPATTAASLASSPGKLESAKTAAPGQADRAGTAQDATTSATGSVTPACATASVAVPSPAISTAPPAARKRDREGDSTTAAAVPSTPSPSSSPTTSAAAATSVADRKPNAAAPPRHLCVLDGVASLLPYPTHASALALLSPAFQRSLTPSSPVHTSPSAPRVRDGAAAATQAAPRHEAGGGLLGFLGTGSAVPSKYRNVSGTFLELHLPAYCFPSAATSRGGASYHDGVHAAQGGVHDADTGATACACEPQTCAPSHWRRGVVILDFGEGSLGQLASLCGRVRGGVRGDGEHASTYTMPTERDEDVGAEAPETGLVVDAVEEARLRNFVLDIVLVFISHAHADHHLGLLSLLTLRHHYLRQARRGAGAGEVHHGAEPSGRQLLVVCPTEVHAFLMDTWGRTAPYAAWLHEDCTFELMPPPAGVLRAGAAQEADTREVDADGERGGVPACRHLSHARAHAHDGHVHGERSSQQQQQQQHVVPMPLLRARLAAWNDAIASALHATECPPVPHRSDPAPHPEQAHPPRPVWWDAEVITVDHPANAHALLLRFPYCTAARLRRPRDADDGHAANEEGGQDNPPEVLTPVRVVPDTSRVLLFSGDTRPSSFLVERSRAFAAAHAAHEGAATPGNSIAASHTSSTAPPSATSAVAPVFILLHEATFGPGFEGEAVRKKHSTLPEALHIGAAVGAEFVVLNHFSQRYPRLPGLCEEQLGGRSADLVCQRKGRPSAEEAAEEGAVHRGPHAAAVHATAATSEETGKLVSAGFVDADAGTSSGVSYANMSFAFDLMSVSFTDMHRGLVPRLTPTLVRLLEEYDSWGLSTTQRMRSGGKGGDGSAGAGAKAAPKAPPTPSVQPAATEKAKKTKAPKAQ